MASGRSLDEGIERGVRYGILAILVAGMRRRKPTAIANASLSLLATYLPWLVERRHGLEFRPWERAYTGAALLIHAVGMLGPYDDVWWWDHLTHLHSATLLGGIAHLFARRRNRDPRPYVLGTVVAGGLLWELLEYAIHVAADRLGLEPLLVFYGPCDTALDLVFDLLGAVVVIVFGDRLFGGRDRFE